MRDLPFVLTLSAFLTACHSETQLDINLFSDANLDSTNPQLGISLEGSDSFGSTIEDSNWLLQDNVSSDSISGSDPNLFLANNVGFDAAIDSVDWNLSSDAGSTSSSDDVDSASSLSSTDAASFVKISGMR